MLKRIRNLVCVCVLLCVFLTSCDSTIGAAVFAEEEQINSREDLLRKVDQGLEKGCTEISFETSKLGKEDLDDLNKNHDGFFGTVRSYEIRSFELLDMSQVTLKCEINDNYYVENALLQGKEIPKDRESARKLLKVCQEILPELSGKDLTDYRKEKWIHDYLVETVSYGFMDKDTGEDSKAYTSYGALVDRKAVCNGYAEAMKLLCDLTGISCEMVSGTADGENHAWNMVRLEDHWYHVDATWDDPEPDEPGRILYHYFNVSDDFISSNHSWEKAGSDQADSMDYNYFVINNLVCDDYNAFRELCEDLFRKDNPNQVQILVKDYEEDRYSEDNLGFLFALSGAGQMNVQTVGKKPDVSLYITMY